MLTTIRGARKLFNLFKKNLFAINKCDSFISIKCFSYWEKPSPLPPGWEVRRDQRGRVYYVGAYSKNK